MLSLARFQEDKDAEEGIVEYVLQGKKKDPFKLLNHIDTAGNTVFVVSVGHDEGAEGCCNQLVQEIEMLLCF